MKPLNIARPLPPDHPAFNPTIDEAGPTIHFTWRSYGELIRILDHAAEFESEAGWSTRAVQNMAEFLVESARSRALHPSTGEPFEMYVPIGWVAQDETRTTTLFTVVDPIESEAPGVWERCYVKGLYFGIEVKS